MSETDDDDGFDKEAVREELREKYERDKRERESTERMSDLLLKGATMTNSHCGACGDPLFRQNGTTFCPSCHGGPEGVEASVDAEEGADGADVAPGAGAQPGNDASGTDADAAPAGDDRTFAPDDSPATPGAADASESALPSESATHRAPDAGPNRTPAAAESDRTRSPTGEPITGDRANARDSLVAALERFATEAATTDDPRYARECLEAAREAAEALSALRN